MIVIDHAFFECQNGVCKDVTTAVRAYQNITTGFLKKCFNFSDFGDPCKGEPKTLTIYYHNTTDGLLRYIRIPERVPDRQICVDIS